MVGLLERQSRAASPGPRVDAESVLLGSGLHDFEVLHVGLSAVVLRPSSGDDLIVTDDGVGLMPGGLSLPASDFRSWRDLIPGTRQRFASGPHGFTAAERVDLRLGSVPCRRSGIATAIRHLPPGLVTSQFSVGVEDGRHAAAAAMSLSVASIDTVAVNFVGLGMGSTPAGDDLLIGACAGLRCAGHDEAADALATAAASHADRTTRAARLYLRAAAAGRFAERVHWLASSLQTDSAAILAMQTVRRWGGSSGADLAAGFLGAQAHLLDLPTAASRRGAA
jgi:hypothetical protein